MLENIKLKTLFYLAFGSILSLLIIVSAVGAFGLSGVAKSFEQYESLSVDTNTAAVLPTRMYAVQSAANQYFTSREESDLALYENYVQELDTALDLAITSITEVERSALLERLKTKVIEYKSTFSELAGILQQQDILVSGELEPLESKMINTLDYLISTSQANSDLDEVYLGAQVREQLLLGLISVARFVRTHDQIDFEDAVSELDDKLATYRSSLLNTLDTQADRNILEEFNESHGIYLRRMKDVFDLSIELEGVVETRLNSINSEVTLLTNEVADSLENSQRALGERVVANSQLTVVIKISVSVLALLTGLALCIMLIRRTWKPLGAEPAHLLSIINDVAGGDLDKQLNPDSRPASGVFAGLIGMQGQLRDARRDRERAEESKQLAAEIEQKKEAEARQRAEDLHNEELLKVEKERLEAIELQKRVDKLLCIVQAAAKGDLTQSIVLDGDDAVSKIGQELEVLLNTLRGSLKKFQHTAGTLNNTSEQLSDLNRNLNGSVHNTANQSDLVSTSADEISVNINSVATAVEQMSTSIKGIAANSVEAASVADDAVTLASDTDATVRQLSKSSTDIGAVVKVINSIAEQTNLLALNATIEAARAGESGKGFAVVANEVKELAKETAKATDEISQKVATIQNDSHEAVGAIANIRDIIVRINKFQTTIAVAVDEQSATTMEMSRAIAKTSEGSSEIARNVLQVATNARDNLASIELVQTTAAELSTMSSELDRLVRVYQLESAN